MGTKRVCFLSEVEDNVLMASFEKDEDKERIFKNGPWLHLGNLILVARWEAGKQLEEFFSKKIQLVVQIHDLPIEMRTKMTARRCAAVADTILESIKLNQYCAINLHRRRFFKFKVEVDLRNPLAPGYFSGKKEDPPRARFRYEKLPIFCFQCGLFDHGTSHCANPARNALIKYDKSIRANVFLGEEVSAAMGVGRISGSDGGDVREQSVEVEGSEVPNVQTETGKPADRLPKSQEEMALKLKGDFCDVLGQTIKTALLNFGFSEGISMDQTNNEKDVVIETAVPFGFVGPGPTRMIK